MKETRRLFPRKLHECVEALTKPVFAKRGMAEMRLIRDWKTVVGESTAKNALPDALIFPKGKKNEGVLTIVTTGAYATILQHQTAQMIETINMYFGYAAVSRIKIEQTLVPRMEEKKLQFAPKPKADGAGGIQAALDSFAAAAFNDKKPV